MAKVSRNEKRKRSRNTGTTVPAHVRINPRNGRIQVFVTPKVAEKLRGGKGLRVAGTTSNPAFVIKKISGPLFVKHVRPLLRAPYKFMPWTAYKLAMPGVSKDYLLLRGGKLEKMGSSKKYLQDYSKRLA